MARKKRYQYMEEEGQLDSERPSRSQKKRDSTALQKLGEELVALPLNKVKQLPLDNELVEALELMSRISDREGKRRQMQYIGKLMRGINVDDLRISLDSLRQGHNEKTVHFHHAERLREVLLKADMHEQEQILAAWSKQDQEEIVKLIQTAKQEKQNNKVSTAKRALFRKLHDLVSATN